VPDQVSHPNNKQLHFTVKLLHFTLRRSAYELKFSLFITLENFSDFKIFSPEKYL